MPYRKTAFMQDCYYHVYCRGNERRIIYTCDIDYGHFWLKFQEYLVQSGIDLICYCLMPNHYHFVLKQRDEETITVFMHRLLTSYAMYFNTKYNRVGYLFENRFNAKLIDSAEYLVDLSRYIHVNTAKVVPTLRQVEEYPWSSCAEYVLGKEGICKTDDVFSLFERHYADYLSYREFISEAYRALIHSKAGPCCG